MSRSWQLFLLDMQEACEKIMRYCHAMTLEDFRGDSLTRDAVLRNLFHHRGSSKEDPC